MINKKQLSRPARFLLMTLAALGLPAGLLLLGLRCYFRFPLLAYYRVSEKAFPIPDPEGDFVAQGLEYDPESRTYLVTGYRKHGGAAPLCFVGEDGTLKKTLSFVRPDGTPCSGHVGGLALAGDYLYLAGGTDFCLYAYRYADLIRAEDGAAVPALGAISTALSRTDYLGPAFLHASGGKLCVGEFYREGVYPTPDSHRLVTRAGDLHSAVALVYPLDDTGEWGLGGKPEAVYSIPDQAQGMYLSQGRIYLSTSWGLARSHILVYDASRLTREKDLTLLGEILPCYALDSDALLSSVEFPPMAEEILVKDEKLYTMDESASSKYIFGKFTGGKWCYATPLSFLD